MIISRFKYILLYYYNIHTKCVIPDKQEIQRMNKEEKRAVVTLRNVLTDEGGGGHVEISSVP